MSLRFYCNGCEAEKDFSSQFCILIIEKWGHGIKRYCKECRSPSAGVPDVYWDAKPEINLADDPHTGQPRVFFSKGQKAAYLRERGLLEAGDRIHGAPIQHSKIQAPKQDAHDAVKKSLQMVKDMGRDNRRQAYLKILKEGRRFA